MPRGASHVAEVGIAKTKRSFVVFNRRHSSVPTTIDATLFRHCLVSKFLHLARKPLRKEAITVGFPFVVVVIANPLCVRVAVLTNENGARSVALVVAAIVMFSHGLLLKTQFASA